jgi:YD repeat-containing protein
MTLLKSADGSQTSYSYDLARNLETKRIEGYSTALARTITTEWHPTLRLPARVAEPMRITTYTYDDAGLLLRKTEQATTDLSGSAGFAATVVGVQRIWKNTYNPFGQVLTAKGPRTDVDDTTVYAYDAYGNLATITNALGHQITLSDYDQDGHVGTMTDANGKATYFTYTPRGLLETKTDGGGRTTYGYDGAAQLISVTLPDHSTLTYSYDAAHRLVGINDNLGNRVTYTLDAAGHRTKEETKDPSGTLTRLISRVYGSFDRLNQVTGAQQ